MANEHSPLLADHGATSSKIDKKKWGLLLATAAVATFSILLLAKFGKSEVMVNWMESIGVNTTLMAEILLPISSVVFVVGLGRSAYQRWKEWKEVQPISRAAPPLERVAINSADSAMLPVSVSAANPAKNPFYSSRLATSEIVSRAPKSPSETQQLRSRIFSKVSSDTLESFTDIFMFARRGALVNEGRDGYVGSALWWVDEERAKRISIENDTKLLKVKIRLILEAILYFANKRVQDFLSNPFSNTRETSGAGLALTDFFANKVKTLDQIWMKDSGDLMICRGYIQETVGQLAHYNSRDLGAFTPVVELVFTYSLTLARCANDEISIDDYLASKKGLRALDTPTTSSIASVTSLRGKHIAFDPRTYGINQVAQLCTLVGQKKIPNAVSLVGQGCLLVDEGSESFQGANNVFKKIDQVTWEAKETGTTDIKGCLMIARILYLMKAVQHAFEGNHEPSQISMILQSAVTAQEAANKKLKGLPSAQFSERALEILETALWSASEVDGISDSCRNALRETHTHSGDYRGMLSEELAVHARSGRGVFGVY